VNSSQFYLLVSLRGDDESEVEMLTSSHFRPYASLCAAAHYCTGKLHPEEKLRARIKPGEERFTGSSDTRCLQSFIVQIANLRGEQVGVCNFERVVLIDFANASARRMIASHSESGGQGGQEETDVVVQNMKYCLHFVEDGLPAEPRVKLPPMREADIDVLRRSAREVTSASRSSMQYAALMTTFIRREVYNELEALAEASERSRLEEGCFLDGEVFYDPERQQFARMFTEFIPARGAAKGEASFRINGDCWSHYYRVRSGRGILLAEGHSHPSVLVSKGVADTTMFTSSSDKDIHRQFFWQFFQSTVILSRSRSEGFQMGLWGWNNGFIVPEDKAYVINEK
jgi:hypothetical protein